MDGCLERRPYVLIDICLADESRGGIEAVSIVRDDGRRLLSKRHRPSKASDSSP
jgi:hypothetical protein